jgi:hypothetical protein
MSQLTRRCAKITMKASLIGLLDMAQMLNAMCAVMALSPMATSQICSRGADQNQT